MRLSATCREGGVSTVASAQCMDSTPLRWFKVRWRSWPFPRPRIPCYSAWGLLERMSICMSMWMSEPLWGIGRLTIRSNHMTETMYRLVYHKFTYVTQTPNPFIHQCTISTHASTSYQPYNGNEWCCIQCNVRKARVFNPCRNKTSLYRRH